MALPTFDPPIGPSPGTSQKPVIKLREAEFGDGYTQSSPDGINHIRMTLSLTWDDLTEDQQSEIWNFFIGLGGYLPFYYQPVGETAPRKWTCKEFGRSKPSGSYKFTAQLVESFTTLT